VESDLDELSEEKLFISATHKENFEEFRERVYESGQIHITRFLQQILVSGLQRRGRERRKRRRRKRIIP
jgi:hypothetical protein